jgi:hypothetical protein
VTKVSAFVLNRNVTSLVLLLVPGLLFTLSLAASRRRTGLAVLLGIAAISVLLSQSGTSIMAFFGGAFVLGLAALSRKATRMLLVAGWTIAVLLAVPLGALPYDLGWQHWTWLPPQASPRASTFGSMWPTKLLSSQSPALASGARAISSEHPGRRGSSD